ncbi:BrnA antitoxin family protein [Massilia sp.]|uniref:BrnA antitoxin family protein n=1 Tax=Massilia sp. TaxID=1882437 RepID=UPI00391CE008
MNTESPLQAAHVAAHAAAPVRRARPPKRKTRITIYLDDEVLNEFRNLSERCGTGYQTLINAALRHRLAAPNAENSLA